MSVPVPSDGMLAGRRALDGLAGVELLEDWRWIPDHNWWSLLIRLTIDAGTSTQVPGTTDWHFVVEPEYPLGSIWVNPAKVNGIDETFHHQRCNHASQPNVPWRRGNICVSTGAQGLDRYVLNQEPWTAHRRLKWYVQRSLGWLEAAAKNELMLDGEPFELPEFPLISEPGCTVAFNEGANSFELWQSIPNQFGFFEYTEPSSIRHAALVQRFLTTKSRVLVETQWALVYRSTSLDTQRGVWIRLPQLPVLEPWQAPTTWDELEAACTSYGYDILSVLQQASHLIRDGKSHVALLGFPLPRITGQQPVQMHWQAFIIPGLSHGNDHAKAFRPTKESQWRLDRRQALSPDNAIGWLNSANWGADEISSRGRVPEDVRESSFAVIGAGALGSTIAELLARAGVADLVVMDGDTLEMGNLVRHTLTMSDLGKKKAEAVASRLVGVSPNIQVDFVGRHLAIHDEQALERLQQMDVIVESTGSDEVIAALAEQRWQKPKLMISVSLSLGAKRMYIFVSLGNRFPSAEFHQKIDPLLQRDAEEWKESGLPWEGVGCWNPVFPARVDDIWLLASATIKEIEAAIRKPPAGHAFCTIEQVDSKDGFGGLRKL